MLKDKKILAKYLFLWRKRLGYKLIIAYFRNQKKLKLLNQLKMYSKEKRIHRYKSKCIVHKKMLKLKVEYFQTMYTKKLLCEYQSYKRIDLIKRIFNSFKMNYYKIKIGKFRIIERNKFALKVKIFNGFYLENKSRKLNENRLKQNFFTSLLRITKQSLRNKRLRLLITQKKSKNIKMSFFFKIRKQFLNELLCDYLKKKILRMRRRILVGNWNQKFHKRQLCKHLDSLVIKFICRLSFLNIKSLYLQKNKYEYLCLKHQFNFKQNIIIFMKRKFLLNQNIKIYIFKRNKILIASYFNKLTEIHYTRRQTMMNIQYQKYFFTLKMKVNKSKFLKSQTYNYLILKKKQRLRQIFAGYKDYVDQLKQLRLTKFERIILLIENKQKIKLFNYFKINSIKKRLNLIIKLYLFQINSKAFDSLYQIIRFNKYIHLFSNKIENVFVRNCFKKFQSQLYPQLVKSNQYQINNKFKPLKISCTDKNIISHTSKIYSDPTDIELENLIKEKIMIQKQLKENNISDKSFSFEDKIEFFYILKLLKKSFKGFKTNLRLN